MGTFNLRVSAHQSKRVQDLIEFVASNADVAALCKGPVSVGDVLRIALERGIRSLEEEKAALNEEEEDEVEWDDEGGALPGLTALPGGGSLPMDSPSLVPAEGGGADDG